MKRLFLLISLILISLSSSLKVQSDDVQNASHDYKGSVQEILLDNQITLPEGEKQRQQLLKVKLSSNVKGKKKADHLVKDKAEIALKKKLANEVKEKQINQNAVLNLIQNLGGDAVVGGYFGLNLGSLLRALFSSGVRQPSTTIANLLGISLLGIPPTQPIVQRMLILSSLALSMLGWARRYTFGGQLAVNIPVDPNGHLNSLEGKVSFPLSSKTPTGDKPYWELAEYNDLYRRGKETELKLINKYKLPRALAVTVGSVDQMFYAIGKMVKNPKLAKDMLFHFPEKMEIVRGNKFKLPHGAGYYLYLGAFIPLIAMVGGGILEGIQALTSKNKKDTSSDGNIIASSQKDNTNASSYNNPLSDPLLTAGALSGMIPGIATASIAPLVYKAATGLPFTGSFMGVDNKSFTQMPVLNASLMGVGGVGSALFSALSLIPGSWGHFFGSLFDISAPLMNLGGINDSLAGVTDGLDTAVIQGHISPGRITDHYEQIAEAELNGNHKFFKENFPRIKDLSGSRGSAALARAT